MFIPPPPLPPMPQFISDEAVVRLVRARNPQLESRWPERGDPKNDWKGLKWDGDRVTKFDLGAMGLALELPPEIGFLTEIVDFYVQGNKIERLPAEIARCQKIVDFYVYDNPPLSAIPEEFGHLPQVKTFTIKNCKVSEETFPKSLTSVATLTTLDLEVNKFTVVPESIFGLENLDRLRLAANKLTSISPNISRLDCLRELFLGNNKLTSLPAELGKIDTLKKLEIQDNKIKTLPDEFVGLLSLEHLKYDSNGLTKIPDVVFKLDTLRILELNNNKLTELPAELGDLAELRDLRVQTNKLKTLPAAIGNLTELRVLKLDSNKLTELPDELTGIYMSGNDDLTSLPAGMGEMRSLREIGVPSVVDSIPESFANLKKLEKYLQPHARLKKFPACLCECENLSVITLQRGECEELPDEIGKLKRLSHLCMYDCPIATLPETLGQCESLYDFIFCGTKLTMLPASLVNCKRLTNFEIHGGSVALTEKDIPAGLAEIVRGNKGRKFSFNPDP